ncbi:MAG: hypothetical protein WAZ98_05030 [Cyclobacteriaceae bacterium]
MKLIFRLCLYTILVSASVEVSAQGFVENALLFSRTKPGGSARVQAMGGAQVALGGDFSSALSNPAGLGMYNRSEFTFSPAVTSYETDTDYLGTKLNDSKTVFNIPGLSYVHHLPKEKNGFLGGSFGISMTRINDFNTTFQYEGRDDGSSIVDYFKERAYRHTINPLPSPHQDTLLLSYDLPEGLAYLTYLITPYNEDPNNMSPVLPDDYVTYYSDLDTLWNNGVEEFRTQTRSQKVNIKGAQYQWSLAYGGNFSDKLFFGASLGITTIRYNYSSSYIESDYDFSESPGYDPLNDLELNEDIVLDGTGLNLTLGLIYRPINFVQVGVSFVTPTLYDISDSYTAHLAAHWNIRDDEDVSGEAIIAEYKMTTPLKVSTGAAIFLGKHGFITGDVEFINYNKAKYDSDTPGVSFSPENDDIRFFYTNVANYRLGAEFRYNLFRIRGGYNVLQNPYKKDFDVNQKIETISAGAGVRFAKFYLDLTWLKSKGNSKFSQYALNNNTGPVASLQNTTTSVMATLGFTF